MLYYCTYDIDTEYPKISCNKNAFIFENVLLKKFKLITYYLKIFYYVGEIANERKNISSETNL